MSLVVSRSGVKSLRFGGTTYKGDVDLTSTLDGKAPLDFSTGDPRIAPELLPYSSIVADLPLNPALLPGNICKLLLYARASDMVLAGTDIVSWNDRSANGLVFRQSNGTRRFKYHASGSGFQSSFVEMQGGSNSSMRTEDESFSPVSLTFTERVAFLVGMEVAPSSPTANHPLISMEDYAIDTTPGGTPLGLAVLRTTGNAQALRMQFNGANFSLGANNYPLGFAYDFAGYVSNLKKAVYGSTIGNFMLAAKNRWQDIPLLGTAGGGLPLIGAGGGNPLPTLSRPAVLGRMQLNNTTTWYGSSCLTYLCMLDLSADVSAWCGGKNNPFILLNRVNRYLLENTATFGSSFTTT